MRARSHNIERYIFCIPVALALLFAMAGIARGAEWYVSGNGDNSDGSDWDKAFTAIQTALDASVSGDSIYLAGQIFEIESQIEWTKANIVIRGGYAAESAGDKPGVSDPSLWPTIITRSGITTNRILFLSEANNSSLENVKITGGGPNVEQGAGVHIASSMNVVFSGCAIEDNTLRLNGNYARGVGIYIDGNSGLALTNCVVRRNYGINTTAKSGERAWGSGVYCLGKLYARDSIICDNVIDCLLSASTSLGGGIYFKGILMELRNVLLAGNVANGGQGAGICVAAGTAALMNCTVADNGGSGMFRSAGSVTMTNSIVSGNVSDVEGTITAVFSHISDADYGGNNTTGDPGFEYGYFLASESPCMGTGSDTAENFELSDYTTRISGLPYAPGATVDRGFHRPSGTVFDTAYAHLYVSEDGDDANSGVLPEQPLRTVTKALSMARDGSSIHVADGTYSIASGETFPLTLRELADVRIVGAGNTVFSADGAATNAMVLSKIHRATISGVTISGGATYDGAGLQVDVCQNLRLSGCTIFSNCYSESVSSLRNGAGIYAKNSNVAMSNCLIRLNSIKNSSTSTSSGSRGGGIWADGFLSLIDCRILENENYGNRNPGAGAGIYFNGIALNLQNVLLAWNFGYGGYGAGLFVDCGNVRLNNCTVVDNGGHGIYRAAGDVVVSNSIVCGNWDDILGDVTLEFSCIGDADFGGNNIMADPLFERGYYLAPQSPCIGSGGDSAVNLGMELYSTRLDGAPYSQDSIIDLGWHQLPGAVFDPTYAEVYVAQDGDDANSGVLPEQPLRTVAKALSLARDGSRIHVAPGVYGVASGEVFPLALNRTAVHILGAGLAQDAILDAAGAGARVMTLARAHQAELSHLAIIRGKSPTHGGGIMVQDSHGVKIADCVISNNHCTQNLLDHLRGGGVYSLQSSMLINRCVIENNGCTNTYNNGKAFADGGGVAFTGAMKIYDSIIRGNTVRVPALVNNIHGSGVYTTPLTAYSYYGIMELRNVLVAANNVLPQGGGNSIYTALTKTDLANITVAGNTGTCALVCYNSTNAHVSVCNSIFRNNGDDINNAGIDVRYSNIGSGVYNDAGHNIAADPLFVGVQTGNYRLQHGSPCIDSGLVQDWMQSAKDLDGRRRIIRNSVDMGCYEEPASGAVLLFHGQAGAGP